MLPSGHAVQWYQTYNLGTISPSNKRAGRKLLKTLKQSLRTSKMDQTSLNKSLANFLLTYRNTPHTTTGETPAKLLMERELCTRLTCLKTSVHETVELQQDKIRAMISEPACLFEKGRHVTVHDYRELGEKWIPGIIAVITGPLSYEMEIAPGTTWRIHTDHLRSAVFAASPLSSPVLVLDENRAFSSTVQNVEQFSDKDSPVSDESCDMGVPLISPSPTQEKRYPIGSTHNT